MNDARACVTNGDVKLLIRVRDFLVRTGASSVLTIGLDRIISDFQNALDNEE